MILDAEKILKYADQMMEVIHGSHVGRPSDDEAIKLVTMAICAGVNEALEGLAAALGARAVPVENRSPDEIAVAHADALEGSPK